MLCAKGMSPMRLPPPVKVSPLTDLDFWISDRYILVPSHERQETPKPDESKNRFGLVVQIFNQSLHDCQLLSCTLPGTKEISFSEDLVASAMEWYELFSGRICPFACKA